MHIRSRRGRYAAVLLPLAVMVPTAVAATDGDVDRAIGTLGLDGIPDQVRTRVEAIVLDSLDDLDDDVETDLPVETRLENSLRRWNLAAPDWRSLPLSVMERVRVCRDSRLRQSDVADEQCGDRLLIELRLREMEQARSRFDERLAAAGDDPTALGDLDRLQARVMEHLDEVDGADTLERNAALGAAGFLDGSFQLLRDRLREQRVEMDRQMSQVSGGSMGGQQ